jgi:hypothetical protein
MSDLLAEILGDKAQKTHSLEDVITCNQISVPEMERLQYESKRLKIGAAAMADEIASMRKQLASEKAAKSAILSSWKFSMMQVCLKRNIGGINRLIKDAIRTYEVYHLAGDQECHQEQETSIIWRSGFA